MKFLHIADLHFGKSLHDCSLVEEDQPYWVERFMELVDRVRPQAVVIAGDVYDRSAPSNEAVRLLDRFLNLLHDRQVEVLMICRGTAEKSGCAHSRHRGPGDLPCHAGG